NGVGPAALEGRRHVRRPAGIEGDRGNEPPGEGRFPPGIAAVLAAEQAVARGEQKVRRVVGIDREIEGKAGREVEPGFDRYEVAPAVAAPQEALGLAPEDPEVDGLRVV